METVEPGVAFVIVGLLATIRYLMRRISIHDVHGSSTFFAIIITVDLSPRTKLCINFSFDHPLHRLKIKAEADKRACNEIIVTDVLTKPVTCAAHNSPPILVMMS